MRGVIDVGGGTRDIFGAGVFDYFLEHGITFDKCYGVSAGCANISSSLLDSSIGIMSFIRSIRCVSNI